ncbi:MAG: methionyl-tRNA formyltransferase [Candidatus Aureabacteria bacterium]|nr:methionyl-tRNA formyltransferase [Candidatus Auribacterota bacterium]
MKIVFLGTSEFAVPSLEELVSAGHRVAEAITQPDRPAGRGRRLSEPPVKIRANDLNIPVRQPDNLSHPEEISRLREIAPDLIVSVSFGRFIPDAFLGGAPRGGINLHPSLLPRWRGAAPIPWALIAGDRETGVTVHRLADRLDAGEVFAQERIAIAPEDDALTLAERLAAEGAKLLGRVVAESAAGRSTPVPQDETKATLAPKLSKEDGLIDWRLPAESLHNRVRGFVPWPGSHTFVVRGPDRRLLKIHETRVIPDAAGEPGRVLEAAGERLVVGAGEGGLLIVSLQAEGGKILAAGDFLRGFKLSTGDRLG